MCINASSTHWNIFSRQAEKDYRLLLALGRVRSELNQKHFAEMFYAEVDEPAKELLLADEKEGEVCNQGLTAEESDLYD